ncbi:hypothetical protein J2129_001857 [Methanofollis sp. W23]|nr:hypothetical protein [Methanofollis sp. W23]
MNHAWIETPWDVNTPPNRSTPFWEWLCWIRCDARAPLTHI